MYICSVPSRAFVRSAADRSQGSDGGRRAVILVLVILILLNT